jgi:hypothetical protein
MKLLLNPIVSLFEKEYKGPSYLEEGDGKTEF